MEYLISLLSLGGIYLAYDIGFKKGVEAGVSVGVNETVKYVEKTHNIEIDFEIDVS